MREIVRWIRNQLRERSAWGFSWHPMTDRGTSVAAPRHIDGAQRLLVTLDQRGRTLAITTSEYARCTVDAAAPTVSVFTT